MNRINRIKNSIVRTIAVSLKVQVKADAPVSAATTVRHIATINNIHDLSKFMDAV